MEGRERERAGLGRRTEAQSEAECLLDLASGASRVKSSASLWTLSCYTILLISISVSLLSSSPLSPPTSR